MFLSAIDSIQAPLAPLVKKLKLSVIQAPILFSENNSASNLLASVKSENLADRLEKACRQVLQNVLGGEKNSQIEEIFKNISSVKLNLNQARTYENTMFNARTLESIQLENTWSLAIISSVTNKAESGEGFWPKIVTTVLNITPGQTNHTLPHPRLEQLASSRFYSATNTPAPQRRVEYHNKRQQAPGSPMFKSIKGLIDSVLRFLLKK